MSAGFNRDAWTKTMTLLPDSFVLTVTTVCFEKSIDENPKRLTNSLF
jgi:hypothetical protein